MGSNSHYLFTAKITFILRLLLEAKHGITLQEINSRWKSSLDWDGHELLRDTFIRNKQYIMELFGVDIHTERQGRQGARYTIKGTTEQSEIIEWMLGAYQLTHILKHYQDLRDQIILEHIAFQPDRLERLLEACRQRCILDIEYRRYGHEPRRHTLAPYGFRQYRHRMYVVGRLENDRVCVLSLDRLVSATLTPKRFTIPEGFNAHKFFENAFGVYVDEKAYPPQRIVLRAYGDEKYYLLDDPLHDTQQVCGAGEGYTDFHLYLSPTRDFVGAILSRGDRLEVVRPDVLAQEVCLRHLDAARRYPCFKAVAAQYPA